MFLIFLPLFTLRKYELKYNWQYFFSLRKKKKKKKKKKKNSCQLILQK